MISCFSVSFLFYYHVFRSEMKWILLICAVYIKTQVDNTRTITHTPNKYPHTETYTVCACD